jgi:glutathione peroxidase
MCEVSMATIDYTTPVRTLAGEDGNLTPYRGRVLLIVNTASKCGFTPQYEGLELLHQRFAEAGLDVLGFPCDQFGKQEPGSEAEIEEFCRLNYGVTFPMYAKLEVNGDSTHALYRQLKSAARGLLGSQSIKWNFTKFLVGRDGEILRRYAPKVRPDQIAGDIEEQLALRAA